MKSTELQITTEWNLLSEPYICGLLAQNPTTFSRVLHGSGFKHLTAPFTYNIFKILSVETPLKAMREMGMRGFSVTIPFKEQVIPYLDELCPIAHSIGAVNTVINSGSRLYGINTDWIGVREAFTEVLPKDQYKYSNQKVLILGAGGAAKAAIHAMQALRVNTISIVNRTYEKAETIAQYFTNHATTEKSNKTIVRSIKVETLNAANLQNHAIIINTTPGEDLAWFPYQSISKTHTVLEMVNKKTKLSETAQKQGALYIPGIRMLLHQGLEQFALFTEQEPPREIMEKALMSEFTKRL